MRQNYPELRKQLNRLASELGKQLPETVKAFGQLHHHSLADGVISIKYKELMALGMSITSRCEGCIAYHVSGALKAGASAEEIIETIGVAILMGGGPAMMYGYEALDALHQFQETKKDS